MGLEHLIIARSAGAFFRRRVALAGAIWNSYQPSPSVEQASTVAYSNWIKAPVFGDQRIPTEITQGNVATWFAYFCPSLSITLQDAEGKPMPGGMQIPPNWVILISFDRPTSYGESG